MLDFEVWPQYASAANRQVMQMPFKLFLCPSDPYEGLTTDWGPGGAQNRSYIIHYYAVAGPDEHSTLQYEDAAPGSTYGHCNPHRGMFFNDSRVKIAQIQDGTATTAMLCEVWGRKSVSHDAPGESSRGMNLHAVVYFGYPPNSNHDSPWRANSFHPGGVNIAFADGSVQFITNTIDLSTWRAISTIRGEEPVSGF
jgi:prepilin-type processing-associated H-X9-DG protein